MHGADAACVLRGHGGDHAGGIDTIGRHRLDIGLNTGTAAAVGSRDGQGNGGRLGHMLAFRWWASGRKNELCGVGLRPLHKDTRSLRRYCPDQVRRVGARTSQPPRAPRRIDVGTAAPVGACSVVTLGVAKFGKRCKPQNIQPKVAIFWAKRARFGQLS